MFVFDPIEISQLIGTDRYRLNGENLMTSCPFAFRHDDGVDHHYSFGVNLNDGQYNCYSCGTKGQSVRALAGELGVELPMDMLMRSFDIPLRPKEKTKIVFSNTFPYNASGAFKKLKDRGVTLEAILKTEVTYLADKDQLIFPSKDPFGNLTGWSVRCDGWSGRYGFFPEGAARNFAMFGLVSTNMKKVYLCEGPVDALKLVSFGLNGIATCGDIIFDQQAENLLNYADSICLVPDIDNAGRSWYKSAMKHFKGKIPLSYVLVPEEYKDVGHANVTKELFLGLKEELA